MGKTLCEGPDCGSPIGRLDSQLGRRLCARCLRATRANLRELPAAYRDCEQRLVRTPEALTERVSGAMATGISLNETAVTARSDILRVLSSWGALVVEDREVAGPDRLEVTRLVAFLDGHLDWLATHDAAADLATELAELADAARQVLDPDTTVRLELGPCAEGDCGRPVVATIRPCDVPIAHQVRCAAGHEWPPHRWLLLARRVEQAEPGLPPLRGRAA